MSNFYTGKNVMEAINNINTSDDTPKDNNIYEKKYKEALERAREQYNKRTPLYDIESIFPELKGSKGKKDEKIKTGLIEAVAKFEWGDVKAQDILDWLEKQKD